MAARPEAVSTDRRFLIRHYVIAAAAALPLGAFLGLLVGVVITAGLTASVDWLGILGVCALIGGLTAAAATLGCIVGVLVADRDGSSKWGRTVAATVGAAAGSAMLGLGYSVATGSSQPLVTAMMMSVPSALAALIVVCIVERRVGRRGHGADA